MCRQMFFKVKYKNNKLGFIKGKEYVVVMDIHNGKFTGWYSVKNERGQKTLVLKRDVEIIEKVIL